MAASSDTRIPPYPNLKITVGNSGGSSPLSEHGELEDSDDSSSHREENDESKEKILVNRKFISPLDRSRIYVNKGGAFITGLDLTSEIVTKKLADRAERFGLEESSKEKTVTQNDINELYKSLDIDPDDFKERESSKYRNIRLDAIHMRGVEEMSTNEVFGYFKQFGPASVEWINDYSCNVVWLDAEGAARALLGLSRVLVVKKKDSKSDIQPSPKESGGEEQKEEVIFMSDLESDDEEDDDDDDDKLVAFKHQNKGNPKLSEETKNEPAVAMEIDSLQNADAKDDKEEGEVDDDVQTEVPVPPGHWRLGLPHPKAKAILVRFATRDDRKLPGAEKRSQYYRKYGNPNYGGLKGLISKSKKRRIIATKQRQVVEHLSGKETSDPIGLTFKSTDGNEELRKKPPTKMRMRMYADDEEERLEKLKEKSLRMMLLQERVSLKRHRDVDPFPARVIKSRRRSIHDRLGDYDVREEQKPERTFLDESSPEEDYDDELEAYSRNNLKSAVSRLGPRSSDNDKFSKFNVWTTLAKSMAREDTKDPETGHRQNSKRNRNDLRGKISQRSTNESGNHDLRRKLERLRHSDSTDNKHRSPLLRGDTT